jgi:hypothetical protein
VPKWKLAINFAHAHIVQLLYVALMADGMDTCRDGLIWVNGHSYSSSICIFLERFQTCQTIPYTHPFAYGICRVCPGTTLCPTAVKIWHFVSHCLGSYL